MWFVLFFDLVQQRKKQKTILTNQNLIEHTSDKCALLFIPKPINLHFQLLFESFCHILFTYQPTECHRHTRDFTPNLLDTDSALYSEKGAISFLKV